MDLTPLMKPTSVAVVGASQRMGRATRVIANLQRFGYGGRVFPINPKYHRGPRPALLSRPRVDARAAGCRGGGDPGRAACRRSWTAAVERGVRAAVVLSSGFGEAGPAGTARQATLERLAAERGLLICGPNCYGVFNVATGARRPSAPTSPSRSRPGPVGARLAERRVQPRDRRAPHAAAAVGLSYIVSCGNQAGVTVEDYVEFLVEDEDTDGDRRLRRGVQAAGEAPAGRGPRARAAASPSSRSRSAARRTRAQAMLAHTGSLAGTPEIIDAALRQSGIVQVDEPERDARHAHAPRGGAPAPARAGGVAVLSGLGGECGRAGRRGRARRRRAAAALARVGRRPSGASCRTSPIRATRSTAPARCTRIPTLFPRLLDVLLHGRRHRRRSPSTCAPTCPRPGGWAPSRAVQPGHRRGRRARHGPARARASARSPAAISTPRSCARWRRPACRSSRARRPRCCALRHAREHRRFLDARCERPIAWPDRSRRRARGHASGVLASAEAMAPAPRVRHPARRDRRGADADAAVTAAERLGYPVVVKIDSPDIVAQDRRRRRARGLRRRRRGARGVRRDPREARRRARRPGSTACSCSAWSRAASR